MTAAVNNADVARKLGVSRASVCRFRNGSRMPRMDTRVVIADVIGWPVEDQATAEAARTWHATFDQMLTRAFAPAS